MHSKEFFAGAMEPSPLIPGLPDDLALQCLIRIPCSFHGILRCVCAAWNRLLSSTALSSMRVKQGLMENCLHVMVRTKAGDYQWLAFKNGSWQALPPMPVPAIGGAVAANSRIYFIGGSHSGIASKSVWSYDPSFNKWTERARMRVPREFAAAEFIKEKIFVVGGCSPGVWGGALAWAEVYDPVSNQWSTVVSPSDRRERWMHGSVVMEENLFAVADTGGIVYDPACNTFSSISPVLDRGWQGRAAVLNGILFSSNFMGKIIAYDAKQDSWQGVVCDLPKMTSAPLLCAVSDKLYVLGESPRRTRWNTELVLAAVDVTQVNGGLQGTILWCNVAPCSFVISAVIHALSVAI